MDSITKIPITNKQHDSKVGESSIFESEITHKEFKVGDQVFLKVKASRSSLKFGKCLKLAARYCGPFEMIGRIGPVDYMIALATSMSVHNVLHVSLVKKYINDVNHVIDWNVIQVEKEDSFQVHPICILDNKIKHLWNRAIGLVKVQWTFYDPVISLGRTQL
jgi:hypothetical protein